MSTVMPAAQAARQELSGFEGQLIGPQDAEFDEAKRVYNAMIDRTPALIARPARAEDVARAVGFACDHGLLLAVPGGAHNGGARRMCGEGVIIALGLLNEVHVDPQARTVRVGCGCTWGDVDAA